MKKNLIKTKILKFKTIALVVTLFAISMAFLPVNALADQIDAKEVIELVNQARKQAQVPVLSENVLLDIAAQNKAQDMIDHDYFAHVSPQGKSPWDFITETGYDYRWAGENLAINFTNAGDQQKAWMNSPLHRKNILNANYLEIGVAVKTGFIDGHETVVTVQEFGAQMPNMLTANSMKSNFTEQRVAGAFNVTGKVEKIENVSLINLSPFMENNNLTIKGWLLVFVFGLLLVVTDLLKIYYKRPFAQQEQ